jgi:hypothetical protein
VPTSSRRATSSGRRRPDPARGRSSTLLTTAGMHPLMPFFLGREQPPAPLLTTGAEVFPHTGHRRRRASTART